MFDLKGDTGNIMPTIDMTATGKNIENIRKQKGISVKDLQEIFAFTTPNAIYKWQRGAAMPTIDNLVVLAVVFQVTIEDILVLDTAPDIQNIA